MDDGMLRTAEPAPARRGIPLDLAPLLLPYRQHERLLLRIERLPNRARFSRGHANDDRSWSLTLDDLHDLDYLAPEGMDAPHTLALRIVSLDGDIGATLAVVDFPVAPGEARPRTVASTAPAATGSVEVELRLLRDALAAAKASLAARETELAALQQTEQSGAEQSRRAVEAERAAARSAFESELQERLAAGAAEATATLEQQRAAWQRTEAERAAQAEARAQERLAAAHEAWQEEAKAALAQAQDAWQRDAKAALAQAEQAWKAKAEEAARLAAATAQRQERSAEALAEAMARGERAEAALAEVTSRCERAETMLADEKARREQAETTLVAATTRHGKAETALAELRAASDADRAELRRLRDALAAVKASATARETELSGARQQAEQAWAEQSQRAIEAELAAARSAWESEFAAVRAAWEDELQQHLAAAAAAAEAQLEEHRAAWQAAQEDHAAPSQAQIEQHLAAARAAWEQEARAALAEAADAWQAGEAERLAAAAAQGREEWAQALAEAGARLERAEAELAEARAAAERDHAELHRLNDGRAAAEPAAPTLLSRFTKARPRLPLSPVGRGRSILSESTESDPEPPEEAPAPAAPAARLDIGKLPQAQALLAERLQKAAQVEPVKDKPAATPAARQPRRTGRWVFAGVLVAALAGAAVFYAGSDTTTTEGSPALATLTDWIDASVQKLDALILPQSPDAPQAAEPRTIVAVATRLHASPSTKATVLATLPRGTEVTPLERHGKWVRLRVDAAGMHQQEGWVYGTVLKERTGS